jgi:hypothetical protein
MFFNINTKGLNVILTIIQKALINAIPMLSRQSYLELQKSLAMKKLRNQFAPSC